MVRLCLENAGEDAVLVISDPPSRDKRGLPSGRYSAATSRGLIEAWRVVFHRIATFGG